MTPYSTANDVIIVEIRSIHLEMLLLDCKNDFLKIFVFSGRKILPPFLNFGMVV